MLYMQELLDGKADQPTQVLLTAPLKAAAKKAAADRQISLGKMIRQALAADVYRSGRLWAVHVQGPDDIIACGSWLEADELRRSIEEMKEPLAKPFVIEWPYSPHAHQREVSRRRLSGEK